MQETIHDKANNADARVNMDVRMGTRRDYSKLVRVRAEWLDTFYRYHPAAERWCPSAMRVPHIEDEQTLFRYLYNAEGCLAVVESERPYGYILCQAREDQKVLVIAGQTPCVWPGLAFEKVGRKLIEFALHQARKQGLAKISLNFHGVPDEVDPMAGLYRNHGFTGLSRFEMLSNRLHVDVGMQQLRFRSAVEIGLNAFYECNASARHLSAEASKKDCDFSLQRGQRWGSVDPSTDWIAAYDGHDPVGIVRMAVDGEGIGILDELAIIKKHRGRGLGICLLARGLSALEGRADIVRLDVDDDNVPALKLYARAGFNVHHHHGTLERNV